MKGWMCDMPNKPPTFRPRAAQTHEQIRGNCVERGYNWQWMQISKAFRAQHPVCQMCNDAVSEDVDHIKPFKGLKDPLRTDVSNLQSLCRRCHNIKTRGQG